MTARVGSGLRSQILRFVAQALAAVWLAASVNAHLRAVVLSSLPWYRIDWLSNPKSVQGWDATGLNVENAGRIPLPVSSMDDLAPRALEAITAHGIEYEVPGRAYGLVQIHRWCGNDIVGYHLSRVNLQHFVTYLSVLAEARRDGRISEEWDRSDWRSRMFSEHGWRAEVYGDFKNWERQGYSFFVRPPAAVGRSRS